MQIHKNYKTKLYCKAKIDVNGNPYFASQDHYNDWDMQPAQLRETIEKYVKDKKTQDKIYYELIDKYLYNAFYTMRLSWNPPFLQQLVWDEFYKKLVKHIERMSTSTATIKNKEWIESIAPLSTFTLYKYFNKPNLNKNDTNQTWVNNWLPEELSKQ